MNEFEEKVGEISYGFFNAFLKEKKKNIGKFFVKNKVGFLPEGMDYSIYQDIKNKTFFKQLKFLIGNHPTLSLILAGIYISSLDGECKVKAVEENRQRVYDKYGSKGVPILNLGTTGFIQGYIKWLSNYNLKHNPSRSELIDIYEGILEDWKERTIFVQGCMTSRNLAGMITSKINIGKDVFFIFASKSAIKIAEESIKQIKDNGIIKESNYELLMDKLNNQEDERVWIFEKKEIKIISQ